MTKIPFYEEYDADVLPERVFVYRNLNKKFGKTPVYSVRDVKTGRVAAHVKEITLKNVQFAVGQKGRERVIKEKAKNVHAGIRGNPTNKALTNSKPATYNPYRYTTFVDRETESPILTSPTAQLNANGLFYGE